jgi:hypothetical protein
MTRTQYIEETKKMRFIEAFSGWQSRELTQEEACLLLGVCARTFRRYVGRYNEEGMDGLADKRLSQASHRRAPVDEVIGLQDLYRQRYGGWNVKHFYSFYRSRHQGSRSYTWVKNKLQSANLVSKSPGRGKHRKRRERAPMPGIMLHQDASTHQWIPGVSWDLVVTMDDATGEHYSMFFVDEEGTASSMLGVKQTIAKQGLFCSLYTDRGSHYWHTPEAGGKVDKTNLTQFGRAMRQLKIQMIAAYSPEARGRSERAFSTHQGRLPKELELEAITDMKAANKYLKEVYMPAFNKEFMSQAAEEGSCFVPYVGDNIDHVLCEHHERTVTKDNCVSFEGLVLQIPSDRYRMHYVKSKVQVHRYLNGQLAVFHGPRKLAEYDAQGNSVEPSQTCAA